jgi:transcriptional regulator with XRE-family HTH domain
MSIGKRIKDLRKLNKLTQVELAKKSNISRSYLADIENDRYNASVDTLKAIANSLNVNLIDILEETTVTNESNLNDKDNKSINRDLKILMDEFKDGTDGSAYYNGQELDENDLELIESAMKIALEQIKIKNKKKYTPNKYKK